MPIQSEISAIPDLDHLVFLRARAQGHHFPVHCHDTYVIQLIERGADWCKVNGQIAREQEVFFHIPMSAHAGGNMPGKRLAYSAVYPSTDLAKSIGFIRRPAEFGCGSFVTQNPNLIQLASEILSPLKSSESALAKLIREFLDHAFIQSQSDTLAWTKAPLSAKMARARNYLDKNFKEGVTIDELSDHCSISKYHLIRQFKRQFKRQFGITPRQFMISQRVGLARRLLALGATISNAAIDSGFFDQSHMTRSFKKVTGYSPGRFVRRR
jgi:AraC-like DNA-binding protein